jgi:hypothetical protein
MRYRDLVEDGHVPGLLVHPDWWEPKHPQEIPVEIDDPIALYRPAPEISIEAGYGDPEQPSPSPTTPTTPAVGTTATALSGGETHMVAVEALIYRIGDWLFIELDGGGAWHISRIVTDTTSPTFRIPFTTPFVGAAAAGNNFYIEAGS